MGTLTVITQPAINSRLLRRHPHNGDLLAPRLHVKVATPQQKARRWSGSRGGSASGPGLRRIHLHPQGCPFAKVDVGDAAVGLAPAQLDDMDGGVIKTEGGSELSPTKGC